MTLSVSDFLPSTLGHSTKSGWLPRNQDLLDIEEASDSIRRSDTGEGLLNGIAANTLLCIGSSLIQAIQFVTSGLNKRAIVFHPSPYLRKEMRELIGQFDSIASVDSLTDVTLAPNEAFCVYVEAECFDLEYFPKIVTQRKIELVVGSFDSRRNTALEVLKTLGEVSERFWLRDIATNGIVRGGGEETIDVSVIVPMFNIGPYIEKSLESVFDQGEISTEIIVVNDGSTDHGPAIVERFASKYKNIKLINQDNAGCSAARQRGLDEAKGTYVGFLDGDDWISSKMFERLFSAAVSQNADVSICGFIQEYPEKPELYMDYYKQKQRKDFDVWSVSPHDCILNPPSIWRKLFRRHFLSKHAISFHPSIRRYDDLLFNAEVMFSRPSTVLINGSFYHYRLDRDGQTVGFHDQRMFVHFDIFRILRDRVLQSGNREIEEWYRELQIGTHFWVSSLLTGELAKQYKFMAAEDIFTGHMFLNDRDMVRLGAGLSREKKHFVENLLTIKKFRHGFDEIRRRSMPLDRRFAE